MEVSDDGSGLSKELVKIGLIQWIFACADGAIGEGRDINETEMKLRQILS